MPRGYVYRHTFSLPTRSAITVAIVCPATAKGNKCKSSAYRTKKRGAQPITASSNEIAIAVLTCLRCNATM